MAVKSGPRISTNGLLFDIDAAVNKSYSGSGLTSNGLIAGIGATLVNGVGFGATNFGYFIFDGSNDYINLANPETLQLTIGTVCAWCRSTNPGGSFRGIVAKQFAYGIFYESETLSAYDWGATINRDTNVDIADGTWKYVVFTFQSGITNGSNLFVNGNSLLNFTYTISNNTSNLFIGSEANAGQHSACDISQVKIYNRILSNQEILQNYNATKGRYL